MNDKVKNVCVCVQLVNIANRPEQSVVRFFFFQHLNSHVLPLELQHWPPLAADKFIGKRICWQHVLAMARGGFLLLFVLARRWRRAHLAKSKQSTFWRVWMTLQEWKTTKAHTHNVRDDYFSCFMNGFVFRCCRCLISADWKWVIKSCTFVCVCGGAREKSQRKHYSGQK